jgi:hypothetical protein
LISVRDLYRRIKEILSQDNTERTFRITDDQLLRLHSDIDAKFEQMITDNAETDDVFNKATAERTGRRRMLQDVVDIREAQVLHEEVSQTIQAKRQKKLTSK